MAPLPVDLALEVLLGLYLGLLTGILPAFVAGALGFLVRYVTGVTLPGFGVVVLALAIASLNGGLLALTDPDLLQSPRLIVAALVVLMLALYAHSQGDTLGATLPRRLSLRSLRQRTLSADVVEFVGNVGQVTVRPAGDIRDMEGYPPLPAALRSTLAEGSWRLPADLPLSELEVRLEEQLRTDHDLADVAVEIDERGEATIAAAPPSSGLSKRVPEGKRAVSIAALVPSGLARGDKVTVATPAASVDGVVLGARTDADVTEEPDAVPAATDEVTDGGEDESAAPIVPAGRGTAGGEGRLTVAVERRDAAPLLSADRARVRVQSRGASSEFEALALLKRAGRRVRKATIGSGVVLADEKRVADLSSAYDVTVLALRHGAPDEDHPTEWTIAPDGDESLASGDTLFVLGSKASLDRFVEATAR